MGFFRKKITEDEMKTVKYLLDKASKCSQKANYTGDVKEFIDSYDGLEDCLRELSKYERYGVFKGSMPSKDLARIENNFQNDFNLFIQRSWLYLKEQVKDMDTERVRGAREKYFADLAAYEEQMNYYNKGLVKDMQEEELGMQE
ncbi:MAG: hypothetical protein RR632_05510 [Christensenella sp.]